jgi:PIN domain nuclease of toxin-antitoxin system
VRALLDTHAFLWSILEPERLPVGARAVIENPNNRLLLSVASIWEIAIKSRAGRLKLPDDPDRFIRRHLSLSAVEVLDITLEHAMTVVGLPRHHRDPFDHMLIAQAQVEGLPIITADDMIARYGVEVIW